MKDLIRFGVSTEPELISRFDRMIKKKGYTNRSEAIRDLMRKSLIYEDTKNPEEQVVGTLTIIYDHHKSKLVEHLLSIQHDHHSEVLSTMHLHLDDDNCLEVLVIKGVLKKIKEIADGIIALKGVKYGELVTTVLNM